MPVQSRFCIAVSVVGTSWCGISSLVTPLQVITSVNSSLKDLPPTLITRHDTATLAALSLGKEGEAPPEHPQNGFDEEDEEAHETNIDSIFGKQENSEDESTSGLSSTSTPTQLMSPEPDDATEMETTEVGENGECTEGVVTTSVTVACSSNSQESSPILGAKERGGKKEEEEKRSEGKDNSPTLTTGKPRTCSSTQILLNDCEDHVTLSVNLNGYDSDDTLSDEESHENLENLQAEDFKQNGVTYEPPIPYAKANGADQLSPSPPRSPVIGIKEDRTGKASPSPPRSPAIDRIGKSSPSPPRSPVIGIKEDRTGKGSVSSKDSRSSDDIARLSPPSDKKRSSMSLFLASLYK